MPRAKEIWCTNVTGASNILNRHRRTVTKYISDGELSGFKYGQNTLIPMADLARFMGTSENRVVNLAKTWDLPLWRCKR